MASSGMSASASRIQAAYRGWGIRGELYYLHGCAVLCQAAARGAAARRKAAARELQQATGYEPREAKQAEVDDQERGRRPRRAID